MAGDLHTHSNFSDASLDIETLPFLAARAGLTHLAVSDHDTALAAEYAYAHPTVEGVAMIPAAELTAFDAKRGRHVHLLCYYPTLTSALCAFFDCMAQRRNAVLTQSMAELAGIYPQFSEQTAREYAMRSGVLYKTHVMRVLFDDGYTDGIYKGLYQVLFNGKTGTVLHNPAYESVETVLELAHDAGAVVILAHPSVYKSMELADELLAQHAIDGLEIDHPRNTEADKAILRDWAQRDDLIVTGGTDFHGMYTATPVSLGSVTTSDAMIARIEALAAARKERL
ncbi:MAG: PHP domain-containing protein [Ruthenibacterium sp.]